MKIIFVDNEPIAHMNFLSYIKERDDVSSLQCFLKEKDALEYAKTNTFDCAFLDTGLEHSYNGLDLAKDLKKINKKIEIAFLTASHDYAMDSYRLGGRAYLQKPYSKEDLFKALELIKKLIYVHKNSTTSNLSSNNIRVKTFGNFDIFIDNLPILFTNQKAKEALAFLVHQKGSTVTSSELFTALWENSTYNSNTSTYVRRTISALKTKLEEYGIGHILNCERNSYSVNISEFSCDYYNVLNGVEYDANHYFGEYMKQYSWGEDAIAFIDRRVKIILEI